MKQSLDQIYQDIRPSLDVIYNNSQPKADIASNPEDQFNQSQVDLAHSQSLINQLSQNIGNELPQNIKAEQATFPTAGNEDMISGAGALLGNMPRSAIHFAKGVFDFFNPVNTIKTAQNLSESISKAKDEGVNAMDVAKEIPHEAYKAVVPLFLQHLVSGDTEKARAAIQNDPVGQIAPIIYIAKMAATEAGYGEQFNNVISTIAKPVITTGSKIIQGTGAIGSQILGAETGAGAASIKRATTGGKDFTEAMRGNVTPEETVTQLQDAFNKLKQNRATEYTSKLENIFDSKQQLDISPITKELQKQLNNFRIATKENGTLDFSRSPIRFDRSAQGDIQNIVDTMKGWGTQAGDRIPVAVDTLKRAFGDLYSDSSNVRSFIQAMKDTTRSVLTKNVPGYEDMTKGYAKISNLLDDIRSATGIGGKTKSDAIFTKITTALKTDKEFRLQMMGELENQTGEKLIDAIAGHNLSKWIPSGLIGKGMDLGVASSILYHFFNPAMIPALLTTSPRIMGEFLNAMGIAGKYTAPILKAVQIVNESGGQMPPISGVLSPREQQERQQQ